ncbi:MAG TPA: nitroreductase/quinone reductase family protein [Acidimicrobiia bacterium]|nr:nitroreductase/quinone reductase family protein [Acidimicrobiia bacterium]
MSETAMAEVTMPDDRPPNWANSLMKWALTKPILETTIGTGVGLLTFEGRRSAKNYTIPVSYHRDGNTVTIVTKMLRKWWHNFETPTEVGMRLAGENFTGKAAIISDFDEKLDFMTDYLANRPVDAKAYGLLKEERSRESVARIIPQIVVIRIELDS